MSGCHGDENNFVKVGTRFIASSPARLCRARHRCERIRTRLGSHRHRHGTNGFAGLTGYVRRSGIQREDVRVTALRSEVLACLPPHPLLHAQHSHLIGIETVVCTVGIAVGPVLIIASLEPHDIGKRASG